METKTINDAVEEFEQKYGAFEFACPETDTISKPQLKKHTDWLRQTLTSIADQSKREESHFCCKNQTIAIKDYCDDCLKRFNT